MMFVLATSGYWDTIATLPIIFFSLMGVVYVALVLSDKDQ